MRSRALAVVVVMTTAGCNQLFGLDAVVRSDGGDLDGGDDRDGGALDAPLPTDWSAPTLVAEVRTDKSDEDPTMSSDGLELYLAVQAVSGDYGLVRYVRQSTELTWNSEPTLADLNSLSTDWTPRLSADDRTLYFASTRVAGNGGGMDVWYATRTGTTAATPWSTPAPLTSPPINGTTEDRGAMPCGAGTRFVFLSARNGSLDLFEVIGDGTPSKIAGASAPSINESSPHISEDCRTLYFSSNASGTTDLMVMTRASVDSEWGVPRAIPALSTAAFEGDPWVSADGRHMLLAIDTMPVDGDFDIYESFR